MPHAKTFKPRHRAVAIESLESRCLMSANYLLPVIDKTNLPAAAIAEQTIKASATVTVTNSTTAVEKGPATVGMYAYDGSTFFLLGFQKHKVNLKPGARSVFHIAIKYALASGTYTVLPYSFDSVNNETGAATAQSLVVSPPQITLTAGAVSAVKPATVKAGKTVNISVTITNSGNIPTSKAASVAGGLSIDRTTASVSLSGYSHVYIIKPGFTTLLRLRLTIPKTLPAGTYYPVITYEQNGISASAVGSIAFTVTG